MPTFTYPAVASFGASYTGKGTNVGYTVYDSGGTLRTARTTSGIVEDTDAAGNATTGIYGATSGVSIDLAWLPARIKWDITAVAGVAAEDVVSVGPTANANVIQWLGTAVTANTAGVPKVDVSRWSNVIVAGSVAGFPVVSANNLEAQAQIDALSAITAGTNSIVVDVNHRVDVGKWRGGVIPAQAGAGIPDVNLTAIVGASVSTASPQLGVVVVNNNDKTGYAIAAGGITSSSFAANAIDAAAIAAGAITSSECPALTNTTNLPFLITGSGTSAAFTVPALANAPVGGGGGTNVNVLSLSAAALAQIAGSASGTGNTSVDHNFGGADALRYVQGTGGTNAAGVDGAQVTAYTLADYTANNRTLPYVEGQATTGIVGGISGRWLTPMRLQSNSGSNTYVLEFSGAGDHTVTNSISL
jgi:hypothetical protein